jgi:hypothetical protein
MKRVSCGTFIRAGGNQGAFRRRRDNGGPNMREPDDILDRRASRNEYMRAYYQKNRHKLLPKLLARNREYKIANREKVRAAGRAYAAQHKEQRRAWLIANKERARQLGRKSERKATRELSASYLRKNIAKNDFPKSWVTEEMIELKRVIIKIKRLWQNQRTSTNCATNC